MHGLLSLPAEDVPGAPPAGLPATPSWREIFSVRVGSDIVNRPGGFASRVLVASPRMGDANFTRTVILVIAHTADGAVGVVLNRPSATKVGDPLPKWGTFAAEPGVVFVGGPVSPGAAICVAVCHPGAEGTGDDGSLSPLSGRLATLDLGAEPSDVRARVASMRVFSGYAGWGAGQLDAEVAGGSWFGVDAEEDDVVTPDPDDLWRGVLHRQHGRLALLANFPHDLIVN